MESVIQKNKCCYICQAKHNLHSHHVFGGGNRKLSEKYGLKVWLCGTHHNQSNLGVHFNKPLMDKLRSEIQSKAMEIYNWTEGDFIKLFGKNYR